MVRIERGKTIFEVESDVQTLVNTINCVGVMGKGIALEFKNRYPAMFDKYKSFCDKGVFKPGVLWIYKADDGKWVLNFPTKVDWKNPSEIEYIEEGLKKFVEIWEDKGIKSIAFPLLGCSNGGLNPDEVIPLMEKYLNQCNGLDVIICDNRIPEDVKDLANDMPADLTGDEAPKEIVTESEPLVDEEPPKVTDEKEVESEAVKQDEGQSEVKEGIVMVEPAEEPLPKYSEEQEILNEIVEERRAMNDAVDKILEDFSKGDNSPEYRKKVAKKIVNIVNRRGFPAGSIFQI